MLEEALFPPVRSLLVNAAGRYAVVATDQATLVRACTPLTHASTAFSHLAYLSNCLKH